MCNLFVSLSVSCPTSPLFPFSQPCSVASLCGRGEWYISWYYTRLSLIKCVFESSATYMTFTAYESSQIHGVVSCGQFAFVWDAYWDRIAFVRELWCWCDRLVLVSVETELDRALSSAFKSLCHHALNRNHIFCAQVFWCSYSPATPKYQTTFLFSEPRTDIHRHHTLAPFQSLF